MPRRQSARTAAAKDTSVQVRLDDTQKSLFARAAKLQNKTLKQFLLDSACAAAHQVLADQTHFVLPAARWRAFCEALDAPSRAKPALEKLLKERSVFDGERSEPAQ